MTKMTELLSRQAERVWGDFRHGEGGESDGRRSQVDKEKARVRHPSLSEEFYERS